MAFSASCATITRPESLGVSFCCPTSGSQLSQANPPNTHCSFRKWSKSNNSLCSRNKDVGTRFAGKPKWQPWFKDPLQVCIQTCEFIHVPGNAILSYVRQTAKYLQENSRDTIVHQIWQYSKDSRGTFQSPGSFLSQRSRGHSVNKTMPSGSK